MAAPAKPPNRFEIEGRADKCWRFARWALAEGLTHEDLAGWDDWQWEMAAGRVGVKDPSEMSRGQVIGYLTPNPLWTAARSARS